MYDVVVLGSLNMDLMVQTNRMPKLGETVLGETITYFVGGKGANQAVAASRSGAETVLLGNVGADEFGQKILNSLKKDKLDLQFIAVEENQATGIALVTKYQKDNNIIVIPGANTASDICYIQKNRQVISNTKILVGQMEIPYETTRWGFKIAKENGGVTLLNPAPYSDEIFEILPYTDFITPNETEFAEMIRFFKEPENLEEDLLFIESKISGKVIVTRGSEGVSWIAEGKMQTIEAVKVIVKDTTGAGDTFNGILASCLAEKQSLASSIKKASIGATLSTTKSGAQSGMPTKMDLAKFIENIGNKRK